MAFKVGEKYECIEDVSPYFKKGKRYKATSVDGIEVAFINEKKQRHWWRKDTAEAYFIASISSKDRISTLEKEVAHTKEQLETLRGDYLKDIELLQERFQKKIKALETVLAEKSKLRQLDKPEIIEFEGSKYQKVGRKAREGDVAVPYGSQHDYITDGKAYKLFMSEYGKLRFTSDSDSFYPFDKCFVEGWHIYEPVQQEVQRRTVTCGYQVPPYKSPNEQRAELIEKAKDFIEEEGAMNIELVVNEEYRAATAIWYKSTDVVTSVVNCETDKVFNTDIFKAIVLGRVRGLDVSEFENAVQPTVAIGQVVTFKGSGALQVVTCRNPHFTDAWFKDNDAWCYGHELTILNDTNAIYTEEAQ